VRGRAAAVPRQPRPAPAPGNSGWPCVHPWLRLVKKNVSDLRTSARLRGWGRLTARAVKQQSNRESGLCRSHFRGSLRLHRPEAFAPGIPTAAEGCKLRLPPCRLVGHPPISKLLKPSHPGPGVIPERSPHRNVSVRSHACLLLAEVHRLFNAVDDHIEAKHMPYRGPLRRLGVESAMQKQHPMPQLPSSQRPAQELRPCGVSQRISRESGRMLRLPLAGPLPSPNCKALMV
jgi:hypothetical protein